ncbi:hypothetical protein LCGC14_0971400 [marine sediment metagenome]|uniref:Uncharacterized protein n=1 Tax=marine sediment metagenome TaxID=412755 RepID=A0A0F9RHY0_9ZZZZ
MDKVFHYSVNLLPIEQQSEWNMNHTLQERHDQIKALKQKALAQIPTEELPQWVLVDQYGILSDILHDVFIAFPLTWLFTKKGQNRRIWRALRMMGVPFAKTAWGEEAVSIAGLKN